jgi:hypothetical protein
MLTFWTAVPNTKPGLTIDDFRLFHDSPEKKRNGGIRQYAAEEFYNACLLAFQQKGQD